MPVPFRWTPGEVPAGSGQGGSPRRWRGRQERIHSPASAYPARRASDRSSRGGGGGGGGGGAALSPPPEGSTHNKSWAEKRRAEKANLAPNSIIPPAHCRASPARIPGDPGAAGGSEGPCAPRAAGNGGGLSGRLQVPPARTRCPEAVSVASSPGFAGSGVFLGAVALCTGARIGRRGGAARGSWLCLPVLPAPSLFSHPLFRRHQLQLLQSVKNVKEIFQQRGRGTTVFTALGPFLRSSPAPLTSTRAPANCEKKNPSPAEN